MRIPTPAALLVDHPVMPEPEIAGTVGEFIDPDSQLLSSTRLSRRNRFRASLHLTIALQLLADFDLWPSRAAFEEARIVQSASRFRVSLGRFPFPLSRTIGRLGGGESAIERLRSAALDRIGSVVGLSRREIEGQEEEPGLTVERAIGRQLNEMNRPIDLEIARLMWGIRMSELLPPEEGIVEMWKVAGEGRARRLAAALWCRLKSDDRPAWIWSAGDADLDTGPTLSLSERGTLIVAGTVSQSELTALRRWSQRDGCAAAAIGTFPRGWRPPPDRHEGRRRASHVAIAGIAPDRARQIVEQRRSGFDGFRRQDRDALTRAIHRAAGNAASIIGPDHPSSATDKVLRSWLELSPRGLPAGFVALHSGIPMSELQQSMAALSAIDDGSTWRLSEPVLLQVDPRHLLVAGTYEEGSGLHRLHSALGRGDGRPLVEWVNRELDALRAMEIRDLLSVLAPGELGHETHLHLAEACLLVFDITGARAALECLPAKVAQTHHRWLECIDHRPGELRELPPAAAANSHPRAAAEIAVIVLNDALRAGVAVTEAVQSMIDSTRGLLAPCRRRRIDIEIAFITEPSVFDDPEWRRSMAGRHTELRLQIAHRRALAHLESGRTGSARRLLGFLSRNLINPGHLGYMEVDLGAAALEDGRSREAENHQLRAYRLLRTAGFEHVTKVALFDLAVADIDQLRVRKAGSRLEVLRAEDPNDRFVLGEEARLALAIGDERVFRRKLGQFERAVADDQGRFTEGLALLRGAASLLEGDFDRAQGLFEKAGQEGSAWSILVAAARGRPISHPAPDAWGVAEAANFVARLGSGHPSEQEFGDKVEIDPRWSLGLALAERVTGHTVPVPRDLRNAAIQGLRATGLTGWAEQLGGLTEHASSLMSALARIVESGGVEGVETRYIEALLSSLGVTGIEVLDVHDRSRIWCFGEGPPGNEHRHGRLLVLPLGADFPEGSHTRLTTAILDLVLPQPHPSPDSEVGETGFYGTSSVAQSLRREIVELGPSHLPVLLRGETGVGKEVVARALHKMSRRTGAFVAVNVAAIPSGILEAELFGSVKGAFTGADRSRQGLAAAADGGTLFLDEVGDLDSDLQVKLLRFLESGEVRAVGSNHSRIVDVRIVSATHADLNRMMREGEFRRDLYFRIAAPDVLVPALRDRRQDIPILKDLFEREAISRHGLRRPVWSSDAEAALLRYSWPGNVRELRQVIEVAMVRASGSVVRLDHLPIASQPAMPEGTWEEAQRDFRRRFLAAALERNNGNRSATARELKISRQSLLYHLRNLDLSKTGGN